MTENKGIVMAILGIVAVIAVVGLVLLFSGSTGKFTDDGKAPRTWSPEEAGYPCVEGQTTCAGGSGGSNFMRCTRGVWKLIQYCSANMDCTQQGCLPKEW